MKKIKQENYCKESKARYLGDILLTERETLFYTKDFLEEDNSIYVANKVVGYRTPKNDDYVHYYLSIFKDLFIRLNESTYISLTDFSKINPLIPRHDWKLGEYKLYTDSNTLSFAFDKFKGDLTKEGALILDLTKLPIMFRAGSVQNQIKYLNALNQYIQRYIKPQLTTKYDTESLKRGYFAVSADNLPAFINKVSYDQFNQRLVDSFNQKVRKK